MLAYLYVVLAIAARVLAGTGTLSLHGFTPLGASLLFFGWRMPRKQFLIPVALLIGTDVYLNFFRYHMALTWDQAVVWAWYAGACCIGLLLRGRVKALFVGGAAVGSSVCSIGYISPWDSVANGIQPMVRMSNTSGRLPMG